MVEAVEARGGAGKRLRETGSVRLAKRVMPKGRVIWSCARFVVAVDGRRLSQPPPPSRFRFSFASFSQGVSILSPSVPAHG